MLDISDKSNLNHWKQMQYIREPSLYNNHSTAGNHPLHSADNRKKSNPQNVSNLQRHTKKKKFLMLQPIVCITANFCRPIRFKKFAAQTIYMSILYNAVYSASSRNPLTTLKDLAETAALIQTSND